MKRLHKRNKMVDELFGLFASQLGRHETEIVPWRRFFWSSFPHCLTAVADANIHINFSDLAASVSKSTPSKFAQKRVCKRWITRANPLHKPHQNNHRPNGTKPRAPHRKPPALSTLWVPLAACSSRRHPVRVTSLTDGTTTVTAKHRTTT